MTRAVFVLLALAMLPGCATVSDVNHAARKIEIAWLLDYQRNERSHRTRVVDAPSDETFLQVKKTLLDMGLPVIHSNMITGRIKARGIAPAPLSKEEWEIVIKMEDPRVRKLSGGMLWLSPDPSKNYELTLDVLVRGGSHKSVVVIDYELYAPRYEAMGFRMPKIAPPQAAIMGAEKFWRALTDRLSKASNPVRPRRLFDGEEI